ncbi:hypothetical protein HZ326_24029 [Fusarium oxysporum f. sp. albedinis]|nr:hypothetical protein HZ326_24029 [Fusarium oxysporum f. sp. albedinis]
MRRSHVPGWSHPRLCKEHTVFGPEGVGAQYCIPAHKMFQLVCRTDFISLSDISCGQELMSGRTFDCRTPRKQDAVTIKNWCWPGRALRLHHV